MVHNDSKALASLPIILITCIFLATIAITIGFKGLNRAQSLKNDQKAINSFDQLIESSTQVTYGKVGENQLIDLELSNSYIETNGDLIELKRGNEKLKSEYLPLPILKRGKKNYKLHSGEYLIKLKKTSQIQKETDHQGLVLTIEEFSNE